MFRVGRVLSVDKDKHTARVQFLDFATGNSPDHSDDFPVLITRQGDYSLPAVDTDVLCAIEPGLQGIGYVLGAIYSDRAAPPLSDAGQRAIASDDLRLGDPAATDKIALAPATKTEIQKALDYAKGIATALQAGVPVPNDGGANLKATIVAALPVAPTLDDPAAENVSAK